MMDNSANTKRFWFFLRKLCFTTIQQKTNVKLVGNDDGIGISGNSIAKQLDSFTFHSIEDPFASDRLLVVICIQIV